MTTGPLYKIMAASLFERAASEGRLPWAPVDRADGFVHLSSAAQVRETARLHFSGQTDLVLLSIDPAQISPGHLRWEPSRGGELFPHVYGDVPLSAIADVSRLPWTGTGFGFPPHIP